MIHSISTHSINAAALALVVAAGALSAAVPAPAQAGGWHRWDEYSAPRYSRRRAYRTVPRVYDPGLRYYNSPRAYRSACGYGDCGCLRTMALRTGDQHWWDKYQACSG